MRPAQPPESRVVGGREGGEYLVQRMKNRVFFTEMPFTDIQCMGQTVESVHLERRASSTISGFNRLNIPTETCRKVLRISVWENFEGERTKLRLMVRTASRADIVASNLISKSG